MCCWVRGSRAPSGGAALPAVWRPVLLRKADVLAVGERCRLPAAGSPALLSSMGTAAGPSSVPHLLGWACAPRMPPARPSWAAPMGAPQHSHLPEAGRQSPPPRPTGICRPAPQPGTLYPLSHYRATGGSQRGSAQGTGTPALPQAAEPAREQHRDVQEPYPAVQEPPPHPAAQGTCPAPQCHQVTGRSCPAGTERAAPERKGSPSPLAASKGHRGFNVSLCAAPISFIDLFSMESSN